MAEFTPRIASAVGGWPTNAYEAVRFSAQRPVDMVQIADSTGDWEGGGWSLAQQRAYEQRVGLFASPLYPFAAAGAGTQYSGMGGNGGSGGLSVISAGAASGGGVTTGADPFFNDRQMPDAPYNLITADITGGGGAPGIFVNGTFRTAKLRYHVYHGVQPGGGSYRPGARLAGAPNTAIIDSTVTFSAAGSLGEGEGTLDIPADPTRTAQFEAKVRRPGGGSVIAPVVFLAQRIQNLDRASGMSFHDFYSIGGQSVYDMAQFVLGRGMQITFTAALSAANAGTLTTPWTGGTGNFTIQFSDGTTRRGTFTASSTAVTWTGAAVTAGVAAQAAAPTSFPSLSRQMWMFGKLRQMQIARGHRPIIIVRITSGFNDRNYGNKVPQIISNGWRQVAAGNLSGDPINNPLAYRDNLEALTTRIEDGWRAMGWPIGELFFLLVPSYPVTAVDDMVGYRQQSAAMAASRPNTSWVDLAALVPGSETIANNGTVDGLHFNDTWADEISRREVNSIFSTQ